MGLIGYVCSKTHIHKNYVSFSWKIYLFSFYGDSKAIEKDEMLELFMEIVGHKRNVKYVLKYQPPSPPLS